jgi:hypothetical protein
MQPPFVGLSRGGLSQEKFFMMPIAGEVATHRLRLTHVAVRMSREQRQSSNTFGSFRFSALKFPHVAMRALMPGFMRVLCAASASACGAALAIVRLNRSLPSKQG